MRVGGFEVRGGTWKILQRPGVTAPWERLQVLFRDRLELIFTVLAVVKESYNVLREPALSIASGALHACYFTRQLRGALLGPLPLDAPGRFTSRP